MTKPRVGLFLAVFLAVCAGTVSAQNYRNFEDDWTRIKAASLSVGPFRIFPLFQIKNVGFSNNVYFEERPVQDFRGTLSPEATVYLPLRTNAIFYIRENPEYTYYVKEKRQRGFTNSANAGLKLRFFQRVVLWGEVFHGEYREPVSFELARPTRNVQDSQSLGVFFETARKTAIGVSWKSARYAYDDIQLGTEVVALANALNREERTVSFEFYYQAWPGAFVFTNAGFSEYRFDQAALGRDSRSAELAAGLRFPILGKIQGTVSAGYRKLTPLSPGKRGFSGFYGDTELSYRSGKIGVLLGFSRGDNFSYLETSFLYLGTRVFGGVSYHLTRFLRLDYNIDLGSADYPGSVSTAGASWDVAEIQRRDSQVGQSVGFTLRLYKTFGLGVAYNSSRWTSNLPGWDRRRDSLGLNLTTQF